MKILIVEDEEVLVRYLERLLSPLSEHIRSTASIREGVNLSTLEQPDLIFLDLILQDSGYEATCRQIPALREQNPNTTILVMTGAPQPEIQSLAMDSGADAFVRKRDIQWNQPSILRLVRDVFDRTAKSDELTRRLRMHKAACNAALTHLETLQNPA